MFFYPVPSGNGAPPSKNGRRRRSPLEFSNFTNPQFFNLLEELSPVLRSKKLNGIQQRSLALLLNRAAMGYLEKNTPGPFDSIKWVEEEHSYVHPWSLSRRLYEYGYYHLDKIFGTPEQYLNTRPDLVELIKSEVNKGAQKRLKDDERKNPPSDGGKDLDKLIESGKFEDIVKGMNFK